MNREWLQQLADWVLPRRVQRLVTTYRPSAVRFLIRHRALLRENRALLNRHRGQRCFILCNGPSVLQQDIRWLRQEIVFSVSNGYRHPDYHEIAPRYHCLPQITYGKLTPETAVRWLTEMHERIGQAELFLSHQEWGLVQQWKLFRNRTVRYLCLGKNHFPERSKQVPDLTGLMPRVQTVPIMAIQIALYMGFSRIYLLGVDHDWFVKKEYRYGFEPGLLKGLDLGVKENGTLETTLWDELPAIKKVWSQYRAVKQIAQEHDVLIYNATFGGMLDEFPRVNLADLAPG